MLICGDRWNQSQKKLMGDTITHLCSRKGFSMFMGDLITMLEYFLILRCITVRKRKVNGGLWVLLMVLGQDIAILLFYMKEIFIFLEEK